MGPRRSVPLCLVRFAHTMSSSLIRAAPAQGFLPFRGRTLPSAWMGHSRVIIPLSVGPGLCPRWRCDGRAPANVPWRPTFSSSGDVLRRGVAGSWGHSMFNCSGTTLLVSTAAALFSRPPILPRGFRLLRGLPDYCCFPSVWQQRPGAPSSSLVPSGLAVSFSCLFRGGRDPAGVAPASPWRSLATRPQSVRTGDRGPWEKPAVTMRDTPTEGRRVPGARHTETARTVTENPGGPIACCLLGTARGPSGGPGTMGDTGWEPPKCTPLQLHKREAVAAVGRTAVLAPRHPRALSPAPREAAVRGGDDLMLPGLR